MADQDPGITTPEGGTTWPDWKQIVAGDGPMTTVRSDSPGFANSAMHLGNIFRLDSDGSIWEFALYKADDPSQGGYLFRLKLVRDEQTS